MQYTQGEKLLHVPISRPKTPYHPSLAIDLYIQIQETKLSFGQSTSRLAVKKKERERPNSIEANVLHVRFETGAERKGRKMMNGYDFPLFFMLCQSHGYFLALSNQSNPWMRLQHCIILQ